MRDIFTLFLHTIVTIIRVVQPGGLRSVVAESVLMRHQVLVLNRGRKRAPNLRSSDRIFAIVHFADASGAGPAICQRTAGIDSDAFSQDADEAKVSNAVFTQTGTAAPGPKAPEKELI